MRADIAPDEIRCDEGRWRAVDAARVRAGLSVEDLWIRYFTFTGQAGPLELEAFLSGLMPLTSHQHDVLACAVNERLTELGIDEQLPYEGDQG